MSLDLTSSLTAVRGTHCVGNGQAAAYLRDGDIHELFAPYYTMPPVLFLYRTDKAEDDTVITYRHEAAGVAVTEITRTGRGVTAITDFAVPREPVFVRRVVTDSPMTFDLQSGFVCQYNTFSCKEGRDGPRFGDIMFYIREGTPVHGYCDVDKHMYCRLILDDSVELVITENGRSLTFPAGESRMMFLGGDAGTSGLDSFYNLMELSHRYAPIPTADLLTACLEDWQAFTARIRDFTPLLKDHPRRAEILETIHSVAVALRTQTSREGGTLAGQFYHLAYGRDMYGVIRGYLALGLYPEARAAIAFFITEFRKRGRMPNAVGMGCYGSHCWECDDVEQTGYYLLELTDYYTATGDDTLLRGAEDYIEFLLTAQERHLAGGMLPFCGDETYIAGGLLPRACISHGSMEATALYIAGASRILDLCEKLELLTPASIAAHRAHLDGCRAAYNDNFIRDGKILTNNPARLQHATPPPYIHGVCNACFGFDFLRLTDDGGYLCMHCYGHRQAAHTEEIYSLDCATLMTAYVHSPYPAPHMVVQLARDTALDKLEHPAEGNTVGYETGLLLYVLATHGVGGEITDRLLDNLLATRQSGGVWSEYYRDGAVSDSSCPYRPWESAINLCGILKLLEAND